MSNAAAAAVLTRAAMAAYPRWREAGSDLTRRIATRDLVADEIAGLEQLHRNLRAAGSTRDWFQGVTNSHLTCRVKPDVLAALAEGVRVRPIDGAAVIREIVRVSGVNAGWQQQWLERDLRKHLGIEDAPPAREPKGTPLYDWSKGASAPESEHRPSRPTGRTAGKIQQELGELVDRERINLARPAEPEFLARAADELRISPEAAVRMLDNLRSLRKITKEETRMHDTSPAGAAAYPPEPPDLSPRQKDIWRELEALRINLDTTVSMAFQREIAQKLGVSSGSISGQISLIRDKLRKAEKARRCDYRKPDCAPTGVEDEAGNWTCDRHRQGEQRADETVSASAHPEEPEQPDAKPDGGAGSAAVEIEHRRQELAEEDAALPRREMVPVQHELPLDQLNQSEREVALMLANGATVDLSSHTLARRSQILRLASETCAFVAGRAC